MALPTLSEQESLLLTLAEQQLKSLLQPSLFISMEIPTMRRLTTFSQMLVAQAHVWIGKYSSYALVIHMFHLDELKGFN